MNFIIINNIKIKKSKITSHAFSVRLSQTNMHSYLTLLHILSNFKTTLDYVMGCNNMAIIIQEKASAKNVTNKGTPYFWS